jgi:hypothetical protein
MSTHESISAPPVSRFPYRRLVIPGGAITIAGVGFIAVVATHLIDFGTDQLRVGIFNAASDQSWSHLVVAGMLVVATGFGALATWRSHGQRGLWATATAILAFLSIDEVTPLHNHVDDMSWGKALYAPILLLLGVCLWRLSDRTDQQRILRAGLGILVVSFGIHVFGVHIVHALGWASGSWAYQVKVALKEGTELAGWLLVLVGVSRLALSRPR